MAHQKNVSGLILKVGTRMIHVWFGLVTPYHVVKKRRRKVHPAKVRPPQKVNAVVPGSGTWWNDCST